VGIGGFLSVLFGVLLLTASPLAAPVLTWWVGIYSVAFGVVLLVLAFRLHGRRNDRPQSTATQPA
jgi:uncharacterized membrane protein HdeD (DUF308 family)